MFIITGGCSFTAQIVPEHRSWANYIKELPAYTVVNTAAMASGNALISRNLISALDKHKEQNPTVIVMWSNPNRFELFYNNTMVTEPMKDHPALHNGMFLKSGGGFGLWKYNHPIADRDVKNYFKYYHTEEFQFMQTLEHILRIQWFCKAYDLRLINCAWQDIFHGRNELSGNTNGDKGEDPIIWKYPSCQHLWDMIDWSKWQHNNLWDYCASKGYEIPHGSHPPAEAQKEYAEEIIIPMLNTSITTEDNR